MQSCKIFPVDPAIRSFFSQWIFIRLFISLTCSQYFTPQEMEGIESPSRNPKYSQINILCQLLHVVDLKHLLFFKPGCFQLLEWGRRLQWHQAVSLGRRWMICPVTRILGGCLFIGPLPFAGELKSSFRTPCSCLGVHEVPLCVAESADALQSDAPVPLECHSKK